MSIDYGSDIYEEPIVSTSFLPEDAQEKSLRPHTLKEYIGQEKAKGNLSVFIEAARRRGESLDHVLLHGPVQPVDLIHEENVILVEVGQQRRQIAGLFDGRAGGDADIDPHLGGDDARQRGLA